MHVSWAPFLGVALAAIFGPMIKRWYDRRMLKVRISRLPWEDEEKEWKEAQKRGN